MPDTDIADDDFREITIAEVRDEESGWTVEFEDGWCLFIDAEQSPVEPKEGMVARTYPDAIGGPVRGLVIDGETVYYRTEEEDKVYRKERLYGEDAEEWLERWDAGESVWSVRMGGIGPNYEHALQTAAVEILRHLLDEGYDADAWDDAEAWEEDREVIRDACMEKEVIQGLRLSAAQWGQALWLAVRLYDEGPMGLLQHEKLDGGRKIQVQRSLPHQGVET